MTPKERAAMQQALGALVRAEAMYGQPNADIQTALREALAGQAEQEPVIGAYEVVNEKGDEWSLVYPAAVHRYKSIPEERITQTFYAAPVRTKDLTDDEIESIVDGVGAYEVGYWHYAFARAVLAAYKEKNK